MIDVSCLSNKKTDSEIDISIVIPAFNEQNRISATLESIADYIGKRNETFEVIVVDDGSSDKTSEVAFSFAEKISNLSVYTLAKNKGKGYVVRFGMQKASGKYRLFNDADGATPIEEIERLEAALHSGYDIAIGSRALYSEETGVKAHLHRKLIGRVFNGLMNLLLVKGISDTQCGFKMFSKEAAEKIFPKQQIEHFAFDVELLFLARRYGFSIAEVPINWTNIDGSKVNLLTDSTKMLFDIISLRIRHALGSYE